MSEAKIPPGLPGWMMKHLDQYLSSGGKEGHHFDASKLGGGPAVPALLLTTKGRKSGEKWLLPLFYGQTAEGITIIASKGGAPDHPGWYKNLAANPEVEVQVGTERYRARAETLAEGPKRDAIWANMQANVWPFYDDYQAKAGRKIPVVLLKKI